MLLKTGIGSRKLEIANKKETIVIGLGNPLMADEGIGVFLIERLIELSKEGKIPNMDKIELYDGGCGGMYMLHKLAGRKKAILIDCAIMGEKPGTIRRFTPEDVKSVKKLAHLSLHEVDILKVVELSDQLGERPEEMVIFGIEPAEIAQKMELTSTLQENIIFYTDAIISELTE